MKDKQRKMLRITSLPEKFDSAPTIDRWPPRVNYRKKMTEIWRTIPISQGPKAVNYHEESYTNDVVRVLCITTSFFPCFDDRSVHLTNEASNGGEQWDFLSNVMVMFSIIHCSWYWLDFSTESDVSMGPTLIDLPEPSNELPPPPPKGEGNPPPPPPPVPYVVLGNTSFLLFLRNITVMFYALHFSCYWLDSSMKSLNLPYRNDVVLSGTNRTVFMLYPQP